MINKFTVIEGNKETDDIARVKRALFLFNAWGKTV